MCGYAHVHEMPLEPEEVVRSSGAGVTGSYEPRTWVLSTSSGRAERVLTAEPSFQTPPLPQPAFLSSKQKLLPEDTFPVSHCLLRMPCGHIFLAWISIFLGLMGGNYAVFIFAVGFPTHPGVHAALSVPQNFCVFVGTEFMFVSFGQSLHA